MAVQVALADPADASRVVEALLAQADLVETSAPLLARRYRSIADDFGDALDALPVPRGA